MKKIKSYHLLVFLFLSLLIYTPLPLSGQDDNDTIRVKLDSVVTKFLDSLSILYNKRGNIRLDSAYIETVNTHLKKLFPPEKRLSFACSQKTFYITYNGSYLNIKWEVIGEDTCQFLKKALIDKLNRTATIFDFGRVVHSSKRSSIYNCESTSQISKKGNKLWYTENLCIIPIFANGLDSLQFELKTEYADSIVFVYTGSELIRSVRPTPFIFTNDTIVWRKSDISSKEDTTKFTIIIEGNHRLWSLILPAYLKEQNNAEIYLNIDNAIRHLYYTLPFWIFWIFVYHLRRRITQVNSVYYKSIINWLPSIVAFFYILFFEDFYTIIETIKVGEHLPDISVLVVHRLVGILILGCLYTASYLWRRKNNAFILVFLNKLFETFLFSAIAYLILGLINYGSSFIIPSTKQHLETYELFTLYTYRKYPYGLIVLPHLLLIIFTYKLFCFDKKYIAIPIVNFTLLALKIIFSVIETDSASGIVYNLEVLFLIDCILFYVFVPILAIELFGMVDGKKEYRDLLPYIAGLYIIFFCCYSVSFTDTFLYFPLTFITAILISRFIFVLNNQERKLIVALGDKITELKIKSKEVYSTIFSINQLEKIKEKYLKRFHAGELSPIEYDDATDKLNEKIYSAYGSSEENKIMLNRLEFGFTNDYGKNGLRGMYFASVISFGLMSLYMTIFSLSNLSSFIIQDELLVLLITVVKFGFAGYTLGYFFPFVKGDTGWIKGLYLGLGIFVSEFPYNYLISEELTIRLFIVPFIKEILIMTLVGFLAFDFATIKEINKEKISFKIITQIEGWKNIAALGVIILSAILAGITNFISGNISTILQSIINK